MRTLTMTLFVSHNQPSFSTSVTSLVTKLTVLNTMVLFGSQYVDVSSWTFFFGWGGFFFENGGSDILCSVMFFLAGLCIKCFSIASALDLTLEFILYSVYSTVFVRIISRLFHSLVDIFLRVLCLPYDLNAFHFFSCPLELFPHRSFLLNRFWRISSLIFPWTSSKLPTAFNRQRYNGRSRSTRLCRLVSALEVSLFDQRYSKLHTSCGSIVVICFDSIELGLDNRLGFGNEFKLFHSFY